MAGKPLSKIFIDASGFIALFDKNDTHHAEAAAFYASLTKDTRLFTTLLVVSETYTWFRYHAGHSKAMNIYHIHRLSVRPAWALTSW